MNIGNENKNENDDSLLLPSQLYDNYKNHCLKGESCHADIIDHENLLRGILSLLSTQEDIVLLKNLDFKDDINISKQHLQNCDGDLVAYFMNIIADNTLQSLIHLKSKHTYDGDDNKDNHILSNKSGGDNALYEWSMGLCYIHDLLRVIDSSFEQHSIASQSILFDSSSALDDSIPTTTTSTSHWILCLLLCTYSLRQCPSPLTKRWRRWQSLVCETIRLFQDKSCLLQSSSSSSPSSCIGSIDSLWIHHILPACIHVMDQLPLRESYHVAVFSGMVGTTTNSIEKLMIRCVQEEEICVERGKNTDDGDYNNQRRIIWRSFWDSLSTMSRTIHSISSSFNRFGEAFHFTDELTAFWMTPYLKLHPSLDENRNDDIAFMIYKNNLSWWMKNKSGSYESHERIANMNTSVNEVGFALLAMQAFRHKQRPMVYHPSYIWIVWLNHVIVLLEKSRDCYPSRVLENEALSFLQDLVHIIPEQSLLLEEEELIYDKPGTSLELFHLLSQQLTIRVPNTSVDETESNEEGIVNSNPHDDETKFNLHSKQTVTLIRDILNLFTLLNQVKIVKKLIAQNDSSAIPPYLQARFLDLLRPIIVISSQKRLDPETNTQLWNLIVLVIKNNLFNKYWNTQEQTLVNVEDLINVDVELAVGAVTMVQLWTATSNITTDKEFHLDMREAIGKDLEMFHHALIKQLKYWSEECDPNDRAPSHYRLFLLDSAIFNTLHALKQR